MDYLSHTPPSLPKGSLNPGPAKRMRAGTADNSVRRSSMSEPLGRLRAASDLCDDGVISVQEKGLIKDMIVNNDPRLTSALEKYERGDMSEVRVLFSNSATPLSIRRLPGILYHTATQTAFPIAFPILSHS